jgi:hypothetical protein
MAIYHPYLALFWTGMIVLFRWICWNEHGGEQKQPFPILNPCRPSLQQYYNSLAPRISNVCISPITYISTRVSRTLSGPLPSSWDGNFFMAGCGSKSERRYKAASRLTGRKSRYRQQATHRRDQSHRACRATEHAVSVPTDSHQPGR